MVNDNDALLLTLDRIVVYDIALDYSDQLTHYAYRQGLNHGTCISTTIT